MLSRDTHTSNSDPIDKRCKWVNVCMCMHALIIPELGFLLLLLMRISYY
jgi:hypothetical protein